MKAVIFASNKTQDDSIERQYVQKHNFEVICEFNEIDRLAMYIMQEKKNRNINNERVYILTTEKRLWSKIMNHLRKNDNNSYDEIGNLGNFITNEMPVILIDENMRFCYGMSEEMQEITQEEVDLHNKHVDNILLNKSLSLNEKAEAFIGKTDQKPYLVGSLGNQIPMHIGASFFIKYLILEELARIVIEAYNSKKHRRRERRYSKQVTECNLQNSELWREIYFYLTKIRPEGDSRFDIFYKNYIAVGSDSYEDDNKIKIVRNKDFDGKGYNIRNFHFHRLKYKTFDNWCRYRATLWDHDMDEMHDLLINLIQDITILP